jgi:alkanesulfonate monooxygenase SsuD/methylene tetrahydromethanopterin reductase-like flavin-dependent oxidoreductase (luciferase family)
MTFAPSEQLNPSFAQEDQDKVANELQPVEVIGPAGFASPDPNTERGLLVPVEDHPLSGDISDDYGANVENASEGTALRMAETTEVDEEEMTKEELQDEAEKRGLPVSGTKAEIADRIREYDERGGDDDDDDNN